MLFRTDVDQAVQKSSRRDDERLASNDVTPLDPQAGHMIAGVSLTLLGLVFQWLHVCPIVKRIWTSSYTLYSGGVVILMLAVFYAAIECLEWKRWSFPLLVIVALCVRTPLVNAAVVIGAPTNVPVDVSTALLPLPSKLVTVLLLASWAVMVTLNATPAV